MSGGRVQITLPSGKRFSAQLPCRFRIVSEDGRYARTEVETPDGWYVVPAGWA